MLLELRQHVRENFEAEGLIIARPIALALKHSDLVVQPFGEAERDRVPRAATPV